MSKTGKNIQTGLFGGSKSNFEVQAEQQNVFSSIMSFLPDNRPITSLQIVEDCERCPKNFTAISRTYDQDADADLWRENNILFGRQTTRYLCISKTEGLPEYFVETLKVIAEKIQPPKQFSLLSRTADTEQKAWRKRQIAYKLSKRGTVTHAVTDIILCSKLKIAPDGFKLAGDINGVLICYKTGEIATKIPPVPAPNAVSFLNSEPSNMKSSNKVVCEAEKALNRLNLNGQKTRLPPVAIDDDHDYEEIQSSYQIKSPQRPAPPLPASVKMGPTAPAFMSQYSTLGSYTELEGVPFIMNTKLIRITDYELPTLPQLNAPNLEQIDYDFHLERQILCTMKSSSSKNPFFN